MAFAAVFKKMQHCELVRVKKVKSRNATIAVSRLETII